jgi:NAD(P)H-dependent FMN reductase
MTDIKILTLIGSLRAASVNRQLAEVASVVAPSAVRLEIYEGLDQLPFYNEDIDTPEPPVSVAALRAAAAAADAALVVTPEYNGTIPGVLKNAIDWLSRPFGASALKDKPLAVIGTAAGRYGGTWAHDETRKSFAIAGPRVIESVKLTLPIAELAGRHPRGNPDVVDAVRQAVERLAAEVA